MPPDRVWERGGGGTRNYCCFSQENLGSSCQRGVLQLPKSFFFCGGTEGHMVCPTFLTFLFGAEVKGQGGPEISQNSVRPVKDTDGRAHLHWF